MDELEARRKAVIEAKKKLDDAITLKLKYIDEAIEVGLITKQEGWKLIEETLA